MSERNTSMNKLGLLSIVLATASLTMVGCASTQSPETAQNTQQVEQSDTTLAQSATAETDSQNGVAVQSDPSLEQAEPVQVSPASEVPQSGQPTE